LIYKNKFENNTFETQDFLNNTEINKEALGAYMKLLFLNDFQLTPTDAKIIFHKKFPNINLNDKSLETYIIYTQNIGKLIKQIKKKLLIMNHYFILKIMTIMN
jgi:hypothetical protein